MPSTSVDHSAVPASPAPSASPTAAARRRANPWLTLCVAVAFGLFMVQLDGSVVAIANPEIGRELHASTAQLQWVTNAYLLALAATLILGGKLGDRFGRRTFHLAGVAGFALSSVAIGLSGSLTGVVAFRALQGVFGGLLMPHTLGLLRAVFPPRKFGMAVGIWAMVSAVSTALGPIVGGLLVENVGWESVFSVNLPIGVLACAFSAYVLPQPRNTTGHHRFKGETWGWASAGTWGAVIVGLLLLVVFGRHETRVEHPLLPMRLFRSRDLTVGTVITALDFFVMLGVIFFVMLYLQNVRGLTPVQAGHPAAEPRLARRLPARRRADRALRRPFLHAARHAAPGGGLLHHAELVRRLPVRHHVAVVRRARPGRRHGALRLLRRDRRQRAGAGRRCGRGTPGHHPADRRRPRHVRAGRLAEARDAVAMGVAPVSRTMPDPLRAAVTEGSAQAFMNGLHTAAALTGTLCVLGAALAAAGMRRGGPTETE